MKTESLVSWVKGGFWVIQFAANWCFLYHEVAFQGYVLTWSLISDAAE